MSTGTAETSPLRLRALRSERVGTKVVAAIIERRRREQQAAAERDYKRGPDGPRLSKQFMSVNGVSPLMQEVIGQKYAIHARSPERAAKKIQADIDKLEAVLAWKRKRGHGRASAPGSDPGKDD